MRAPVQKQIGKHLYEVTQLDLNAALGILPIVLRALGPTLAAVLEGAKSLSEVLEDGKAASAALREFSRSLSAEDLREINKALIGSSKIQSQTQAGTMVPLASVSEKHFPEHYNEWLVWLVFAVRVNFESFLGGLGNVESFLAGLRKVQASGSPMDSTGTSGDS
jgi:hypothetical protein